MGWQIPSSVGRLDNGQPCYDPVTKAENSNATYISELNGPMRPKYPPNKVQEELLSSLTQVRDSCLSIGTFAYSQIIKLFCTKGDQMYNAYEKDIAVVNLYFGDSTAFGE